MIEVTLLIPEDCTECKYYHYCTQSAYGLGLCKYKECIEALGQQKAEEYNNLHSKCRKKHSECR